jgi:hypothetical protein
MGANQNSSEELGLYPRIHSMSSLLTRQRPYITIGKLSALETGLGTAVKTQNSASKTTRKIDDKNWIKEQFISS